MSFVFTDRVSAYPYRYLVTPEQGEPYYITLERADEPTTVGTPLNAETFNQLITDLENSIPNAIPKATAIRVTNAMNTDMPSVVVAVTLDNGEGSVSIVHLNENGYPYEILVDEVTIPVTWEGFE